MYLNKINNPSDVKKLNIDECQVLASEIREALIDTVSKTGGHLSSNLGIVEITLALHYVFDSPVDKIIFDTSHQCYTHKILTGRKDAFMQEPSYGKYSGYTNPHESEHDFFEIGHTSTSISLACGMAKSRDQKGGKENIIAVIGDASLGGGEALEGLSYGGSELNSNFIIVLNDNQMSIAENHGGLYKGLQRLRETKGEDSNNIFRFMGYDYIFVENGHDMKSLVNAFAKVKNIDRPIVIHTCTKKGMGYSSAEENVEEAHFVKPFNKVEGVPKTEVIGERYDIIVRDYLLKRMKADSNVVLMTAAMPVVLGFTKEYREQAGEQYIDVGISEQHLVSMAAGIAKNGGKPVLTTRATFFQRAYDQISQDVCINNAAITMIVVNASIYSPTDKTHIGIFDIAMMSNIPNLVYLAPTNKQEYLAMLEWSIEQNEHPVALRAPRNGVYSAGREVQKDYSDINKYEITKRGEKIAILALGDFYQFGESLCQKIEEKINISSTLINPRYITGIDGECLDSLADTHDIIITLEDGVLDGGFGQKVASYYGKYDLKILNYGIKKGFFDGYDVQQVLIENRLDCDMIIEDVRKLCRRL